MGKRKDKKLARKLAKSAKRCQAMMDADRAEDLANRTTGAIEGKPKKLAVRLWKQMTDRGAVYFRLRSNKKGDRKTLKRLSGLVYAVDDTDIDGPSPMLLKQNGYTWNEYAEPADEDRPKGLWLLVQPIEPEAHRIAAAADKQVPPTPTPSLG